MKTVVIGGGPAGMMAAISAAMSGDNVILYEKNEKLGKKLFITGKGRCNVTNASDMRTVMDNVVSNPRFLFAAFRKLSNEDLMQMLENAGCPLKVERGNRVFPVSDHSWDIIDACDKLLKENHVKVVLNKEVKSLVVSDGICYGVKLSDGNETQADRVIVATGGLSYESTGSTGDGLRWAEKNGHTIVKPVPSLVPLVCKESRTCASMMGLSLKNVTATLYDNGREIYSEFGEMLFTHFGVSGPLILSASCHAKTFPLILKIDLKPALDREKLDARLLRDFEENKNKELKNSLNALLPSGIISTVIEQSGIQPEKKINEITKQERQQLIDALKGLAFTVTKKRDFSEAIITQGGISVKEIDPGTMESKKVRNLFFAGEVIDVDAMTGGYNLQIAWSTGYTAGGNI